MKKPNLSHQAGFAHLGLIVILVVVVAVGVIAFQRVNSSQSKLATNAAPAPATTQPTTANANAPIGQADENASSSTINSSVTTASEGAPNAN